MLYDSDVRLRVSSPPGWHSLLLESCFIYSSWPEELDSIFPPFGEFTLVKVPGQNPQENVLTVCIKHYFPQNTKKIS